VPRFIPVALGYIFVTSAAIALAQQPVSPAAKPAWVPPGTPGSPIDGTIFHAQVLLGQAGFSSGVIDGKDGMSFKAALRGYQHSRDLPVTGKLDPATRSSLLQGDNRPSTVRAKLGPQDISYDYVYPFPKKPEAQAKLDGMKYRNMLEEVAERYHTTPRTIVALNGPTALIGRGQTLRLPNVLPSNRSFENAISDEQRSLLMKLNVDGNEPDGDYVIVDKSEGLLKVMNEDDRLVAQFPVTTGSSKDPLPLGTWKATTYAFDPPFHYQPDLFWDVADTKEEQKLPPGPNGPVGVAWLDLTKEHYGIHGTPEPQTIGRTESHGCIRMTNWDVMRLSLMVKPGFKAVFQA
jgi:peptidoglycan hydrolase-like protein with peptidoglycan-binding domain